MPLLRTRLQNALQRQALSFDGVDDYVLIDTLQMRNLYFPFTIEIFANVSGPNISNVAQGLIAKRSSFSTLDWELFIEYNREIMFWIGEYGAIKINTGYIINYGSWYHIVAVASTSKAEIYVNSERIYEYSGTLSYTVDEPIHIGVTNPSSNPLNGYVAYVRIYNRALDKSEILHNYYYPDTPVTRGLVLWLAWDTISETTWTDKSGYGNDATIYGAVPVEYVRTPIRLQTSTREQTPTR